MLSRRSTSTGNRREPKESNNASSYSSGSSRNVFRWTHRRRRLGHGERRRYAREGRWSKFRGIDGSGHSAIRCRWSRLYAWDAEVIGSYTAPHIRCVGPFSCALSGSVQPASFAMSRKASTRAAIAGVRRLPARTAADTVLVSSGSAIARSSMSEDR